MSTGLGYRYSGESAPRVRTAPSVQLTSPVPTPAKNAASSPATANFSVPKGILPVLLYSAFFFMFPYLNAYVTYDFTDTMVRVSVIASSAIAVILILIANDCVAWYNMALIFHISNEVTVLDSLATYAQADGRHDSEMVLAWITFGVIIAHLVPFLVLDRPSILTLAAAAGVVVNTAALVFVDTGSLLMVGFSSSVLLACVLLIACIDCVRTSLLSQLRQTVQTKSIVSMQPYAM